MRQSNYWLVSALSVVAAMLLAACAPKARAENRAMAAAVLDKAGPDSQFVDASTDAHAAIRHVPSGMVCPLPKDGVFDFEAFPAAAANGGAFCASASNGVATTFMAVHFREPTTLDRAFSEALAVSAGPAAPRPWSGQPSPVDTAPPGDLPHYRVARFEGVVGGAPSYLRVAMGEAQGWYIQQIVSAPIAQAEAVEAAAGADWRRALREFMTKNSPALTSDTTSSRQ